MSESTSTEYSTRRHCCAHGDLTFKNEDDSVPPKSSNVALIELSTDWPAPSNLLGWSLRFALGCYVCNIIRIPNCLSLDSCLFLDEDEVTMWSLSDFELWHFQDSLPPMCHVSLIQTRRAGKSFVLVLKIALVLVLSFRAVWLVACAYLSDSTSDVVRVELPSRVKRKMLFKIQDLTYDLSDAKFVRNILIASVFSNTSNNTSERDQVCCVVVVKR